MACDLEKAIKKIEVLLKTPDYKGNEKLVEAKGLAEQLMKSKRIENKSTESKQVQKENDTSFQHTSKLIKAEENKALFNSIQKRLKEMYPKIRATELDQILDEQGQEVLGRAVNGVVEYSKKAAIDTLPHEYAHVYINLLEKTTYVDNVLRKISKEQGLNRYEAKEYLVTHMGEKFVAYAKQGKIDDKPVLKLADKVWQFIRKVFGSKDIATTAERMTIIAERFYEGVNADAISAQPKEGFEKVDTEATFKDQPFAAEVLKTVMNKAKGTAVQFTGSAALALQGDIYRKGKDGITDLHDLDFAVVDENTLDSLRSVMFNDFSAYQIYDFGLANGDTKRIATMIVTDKKHKVLHSSVKRSNKLRVVEYSIVDTQTKEEVGTYKADINGRNEITEEHTTGVKAVIVDLMLDSSKGGGIKYHSKELGQEIILSDAASTFDAKNSMGDVPRDKDIRDFTSFYKEEQIDVTGELKQEYKGKVIAANSGTGKSVVANNTEGIIDSDVLLRKVLKIENSASISEALKGKNKREVYLELAKLIKNEVAKGNTVVTPSTEPEIAKLIDIAVIQEDAYVVQRNSNSNKRSDGLSRSLSSAKSSIELFKNNTKKIETVKLTPHEFLADVLLKSNEKPGKLNQQNGTKELRSSALMSDEDILAKIEAEVMTDQDFIRIKKYSDRYIKKLGIKVTHGEYSVYAPDGDTNHIQLKKRENKKEELAVLHHELKHAITSKFIEENLENVNMQLILSDIEKAIYNNSSKFSEHTLARLNYALKNNGSKYRNIAEVVAILSTEKTVRNEFMEVSGNSLLNRFLAYIRNLLNNPSLLITNPTINKIDKIVKESERIRYVEQSSKTLYAANIFDKYLSNMKRKGNGYFATDSMSYSMFKKFEEYITDNNIGIYIRGKGYEIAEEYIKTSKREVKTPLEKPVSYNPYHNIDDETLYGTSEFSSGMLKEYNELFENRRGARVEFSEKQEDLYNHLLVDYLFNLEPKLGRIGTKKEYIEFTKSIFPNSKFSKLVNHRTPTRSNRLGKNEIVKEHLIKEYPLLKDEISSRRHLNITIQVRNTTNPKKKYSDSNVFERKGYGTVSTGTHSFVITKELYFKIRKHDNRQAWFYNKPQFKKSEILSANNGTAINNNTFSGFSFSTDIDANGTIGSNSVSEELHTVIAKLNVNETITGVKNATKDTDTLFAYEHRPEAEIIVRNPEQIYLFGTEQDVKNFKEWKNNQNKDLDMKQDSGTITEQDKAMDEILEQIPCDK